MPLVSLSVMVMNKGDRVMPQSHPPPFQQVSELHNPERLFRPRVKLHGGPADSSVHYEKEPGKVHASVE